MRRRLEWGEVSSRVAVAGSYIGACSLRLRRRVAIGLARGSGRICHRGTGQRSGPASHTVKPPAQSRARRRWWSVPKRAGAAALLRPSRTRYRQARRSAKPAGCHQGLPTCRWRPAASRRPFQVRLSREVSGKPPRPARAGHIRQPRRQDATTRLPVGRMRPSRPQK